MIYQKFSKRQLLAMTWWKRPAFQNKDAIICDGAVRSGKTISMAVGFLLWSMNRFDGQVFGICGKTIESLRRNVIIHLPLWMEGILTIAERRSENKIIISDGKHSNTYFLFGGRDESSYSLIQGITLAGILLDEVALMPRSFVEQAIARCSVSGSKFWFNCNPAGPDHWFYKEWVCKPAYRNALHLRFTMADNFSLDQEVRDRYERMYDGVFYKRYIKGEWVAAEGTIYHQFADNPARWLIDFTDADKKRERLSDVDFVSIGVDFGGNRSLTTFVATAIHRGYKNLTVLKDYHIKGNKGEIDSNRVNNEFIGFVNRLKAEFPGMHIKYCFADSEAQYLINGLIRAVKAAGLGIGIGDSAKYEIVQRIYCTLTLLNTDRIMINKECGLVTGGLTGAVWDSTKAKDTRLDNFSSDIDILDAFEYSFERFIKKLVPMEGGRA